MIYCCYCCSDIQTYASVLQIRRGKWDNLGIIFQNVYCDPSLEPSCRDGSNEGSQHDFLRKKKNVSLNYPQYCVLSGGLMHTGRTNVHN